MQVDVSKINTAIVIIIAIVLLMIITLIFFVVLYRNRHNFFLKEKELLETRHAQVLLQSQVEIQENILTQISREIHDNIGQVLSLVRLNVNTVNENNITEKMSFTDELLGRVIRDLRGLSHTLNTAHIQESGIETAVGQLLESLHNTGRFETLFTTNGIPIDLDNEKTIILFRIIQEIVNNIVRHAKASAITVTLKRKGEKTVLSVMDNGIGFDTAILENAAGGTGIRNIYHRAEMIPAKITITSSAGEGTLFEITL